MDSGSVCVGGTDVRKYDLKMLRDKYKAGGAELARTGNLTQETIDLLQKPLFSDDAYVTLVTEFVTHMFDRPDNF